MKSEINLLPPLIRRARQRRLYEWRLNRLYKTAVIGLLIVGLTYGGVWWAMWQSSEAVRSEASGGAVSPDEAVRRQVYSVNELLRAVHDRAAAQEMWVTRLPDALEAAPAEVSIATISLRNSTSSQGESLRTLVITGTSPSRSAIVAYEQRLRELPWALRVEAPLQNLASAAVVNFSFTIYKQPEGI